MATTLRIDGTSKSVDSNGIEYVWAGHSLTDQVPGDGTAECEALVDAGVLAAHEWDVCECGCTGGRCLVYRVITDRVVGGGTDEDRDSGRIVAIHGRQVEVAWDSGVRTTQPAQLLRAKV